MSRNELFTTQVITNVKRSTFDLSHDNLLTFQLGRLIPGLVQECLPGETWRIGAETLVRFQPLVAPVYQRFRVFRNYFFVPSRILWKEWEDFIIKQDVDDTIPHPSIELVANRDYSLYDEGSLFDYIGGVPCRNTGGLDYSPSYLQSDDNDINALPFAAYQKIYYEYFRDQNQIDGEETPDDGFKWFRPGEYIPSGKLENVIPMAQQFQNLLKMRTRAWKKDYFTSALPWAQRGEQVNIPLAFDDAIVQSGDLYADGAIKIYKGDNTEFTTNQGLGVNSNSKMYTDIAGVRFNEDSNIIAKTSELQMLEGSINDLRVAFQVQKWLELNAVGGTRYTEFLQKHFASSPRDERLQRPEYIGGDSQSVVISEVLQTTPGVEGETEGVLGDFAGHAISAKNSKMLTYNTKEHGWMIGLISVLPDALYFQGVQKFLWKKKPFDYAFPTFANLGEQEILNKELLYNGEADYVNDTFGYTPRYAEYKFINNRVCGQFRSSLNFWHYGRILYYGSGPGAVRLNKQFLEYSNDGRIFAVTDTDHVLAHVAYRLYVTRPLPKYGTPISL